MIPVQAVPLKAHSSEFLKGDHVLAFYNFSLLSPAAIQLLLQPFFDQSYFSWIRIRQVKCGGSETL